MGTFLRKKDEECTIFSDIGTLCDQYPHHWEAVMGKGYQCAAELACAIIPKTKAKNRILTTNEEATNKKKSLHRIIMENWFGRLKMLWGIMVRKWG